MANEEEQRSDGRIHFEDRLDEGPALKKIAVLTGGGDCPGLNNAIKQIVKSALGKFDVAGITEGWLGAIQISLRPDSRTMNTYTTHLTEEAVRRVDREGGTMLMTSRENPFKYTDAELNLLNADVSDAVLKRLNDLYYAIVVIGGEDTLGAAGKLAQKGLRVIGVPKTIDKDLCGTQYTLGFDTALNVANSGLRQLRSSAGSHGMVFFVEIMGRRAGHLTYHAGMASNVHYMTIPEVETDLDGLFKLIHERKPARYPGYHRDGRRYTMVAVAEGTRIKGIGEILKDRKLDQHGNPVLGDVTEYIVKEYIARTGDRLARSMALRYLPRSGEPSAQDSIRGIKAGKKALDLILRAEFGRMVSITLEGADDVPLADVIGRIRVLDAQVCYDSDNFRPVIGNKFFHEREIAK